MKAQSDSSNKASRLIKDLLKLFFPLLAAKLSAASIGMVELSLASKLGSQAQAAVGLCDQILFLLLILASGFTIALSSILARSRGGNYMNQCRQFISATIALAFFLGTITSLIGYFAADSLSFIFTRDPGLLKETASFTASCSIGNLPYVLLIFIAAIFRSMDKPERALFLYLLLAGSCAALSIAFFTFFPDKPELCSIKGLALSWNVSVFSSAFVALLMLLKDDNLFSLQSIKDMDAIKSCCLEILKLGIPALLSEAALFGSQLLSFKIIAIKGAAIPEIAAWIIKLKIEESLVFLPLLALSMSTCILVAQSWGAGKRAIAGKLCICATGLGTAFLFVLSLLFAFQAEAIAALFSNDSFACRTASYLLGFSPTFFPLLALTTIPLSGLEGTGNTRLPMFSNLIACLLLKPALSLLFIQFGPCFAALIWANTATLVLLLPYSLRLLMWGFSSANKQGHAVRHGSIMTSA